MRDRERERKQRKKERKQEKELPVVKYKKKASIYFLVLTLSPLQDCT